MESAKKPTKSADRSRTYLRHKATILETEDDIFCVKYSPDGEYIAFACGDGYVRILSRRTTKVKELIADPKKDPFNQMPITCIRWREDSKILTTSSADGFIYFWHVKSGKLLFKIAEEENQTYCLDYDRSFEYLATAGKDHKVRLYDNESLSLLSTMERGGSKYSGHSNRIFALKFHQINSNLLLSGGWDNVVYGWDIRQNTPSHHISGPNISGESIDVIGNNLLAGSFTDTSNLCIYDLRKLKDPLNLSWFCENEKVPEGIVPSCVYTAMFLKSDPEYILAGGANKNELRLFRSEKPISKITMLETPCLSVDCHPEGDEFSFGCSDGGLHIIGLNTK
ncbi:unnamed protein product [Moneuplotes crassus]|uniref:Anaphase-promoting complex subunit 4-like WD40 domain-containing protein n=1 Tax=Euplotes crassus TaxID=5936 RepID=A0AAD1UIQ0_EUPCR|nr:unnamed protein product [Moneuplotes crassus]